MNKQKGRESELLHVKKAIPATYGPLRAKDKIRTSTGSIKKKCDMLPTT